MTDALVVAVQVISMVVAVVALHRLAGWPIWLAVLAGLPAGIVPVWLVLLILVRIREARWYDGCPDRD